MGSPELNSRRQACHALVQPQGHRHANTIDIDARSLPGRIDRRLPHVAFPSVKLCAPPPAYAYVICDTTKAVEIIAENKGTLRTPDNLGYQGYNAALAAYVEIISYTKLVRDAKKRNRILFDKLHLPPSSG